jgi:hypothetical protein
MEGTRQDHDSEFNLPWRTMALAASGAAICIGVGSLGALVIVASEHGADGLATVALALAILAFTSQIIVFVAQVFTANKQTTRGEEIYARMNGLLEGLKGTTDATQSTMERHMSVLLKAAVGEAAQVVDSSDEHDVKSVRFDPVEFEQRVLERAQDVATDIPASAFTFASDAPRLTAEAEVKLDELLRYPERTQGAMTSVEALKKLSPWAVQLLAEFGQNEVDSLQRGREPGLQKMQDAPVTQELVKNGLVELAGNPAPDSSHLARLTSQGRAASALIIQLGRPPDWIIEFLGGQ